MPLDLPAEPIVDPVVEAQQRLETSRRLKQEKELIFELAGEKSLREELTRLARETAAILPPPPRYIPPAHLQHTSNETMLLFLSDWHAYEIVKGARVQGLNEYNAEVFARRAKRIIDTSLSIKQRMEDGNGWRVKNCVVAANGDFVSGTIHDVEKHTDAPHIIAAVYGCAYTMALGLRDLAGNFEKVEVFCTSGNHGRLPDQKKMSQKDPTRNWDSMIYILAQSMLRDVVNVKFYIPDSYVLSFSIGESRFVQYHGHDIKSWNAIPFYGIGRWTRGMQALRAQRHEPTDYFLISHFHSDSSMPSSGSQTKINGSLIGGTEFAVTALGVCDRPTQKLMFVSDPFGVNSEWSIFGDMPGETNAPSYPVYPWEAIFQ